MTHTPHRQTPKPKGFTLVELLVAVAIIALLIAIGVTAMNTTMRNQEKETTRQTVKVLEDMVNDYVTEHNASLPPLTTLGSTSDTNYQNNAKNFLGLMSATELGRQKLATLEKGNAVVLTRSAGGVITGVSSGPVDAWKQPILMSGDQTATFAGTQRWFWSIGPTKVGGVAQTNDSAQGNPVKGDDIGGNVNTTH